MDRYDHRVNYYDGEHPDDGYKGTVTIQRYYVKGIHIYIDETEISIPSQDDAIALSKILDSLIENIESLEGEVAQLSE